MKHSIAEYLDYLTAEITDAKAKVLDDQFWAQFLLNPLAAYLRDAHLRGWLSEPVEDARAEVIKWAQS
jgi:hypothetical protein